MSASRATRSASGSTSGTESDKVLTTDSTASDGKRTRSSARQKGAARVQGANAARIAKAAAMRDAAAAESSDGEGPSSVGAAPPASHSPSPSSVVPDADATPRAIAKGKQRVIEPATLVSNSAAAMMAPSSPVPGPSRELPRPPGATAQQWAAVLGAGGLAPAPDADAAFPMNLPVIAFDKVPVSLWPATDAQIFARKQGGGSFELSGVRYAREAVLQANDNAGVYRVRADGVTYVAKIVHWATASPAGRSAVAEEYNILRKVSSLSSVIQLVCAGHSTAKGATSDADYIVLVRGLSSASS